MHRFFIFLIFSTLLSFAFEGFSLENISVKKSDITQSGAKKDDIPAIVAPKFLPIHKVDYLYDDDTVIGVIGEGKARAYPFRILVWHELVNDTFEGKAILISYCPSCSTAMIFDREIEGKVYTFGVSGLLYKNNILMYDHQTDSLWSQLMMSGISNEGKEKPLTIRFGEQMSWKAWKEKYPTSEILSTDTGFKRHYGGESQGACEMDKSLFNPFVNSTKKSEKRSRVIGVVINKTPKAYEIESLEKSEVLKDNVGGIEITIRYDETFHHTVVTDAKGNKIPYILVYAFAWEAFYPHTCR